MSIPHSSSQSSQNGEIFALYQARLRAEEIDFEAREQYNAEFQKLINQENAKVNEEFHFQEAKIDREAKIQYSVTKNDQRIQILTSQQRIIEEAQKGAREKLKKLRESGEYKDILKKLIRQSVKTLSEKEAVVSVVKKDVNLAKECINSLNNEFKKLEYNVTVNESEFLDDSLIGGCIVINGIQTIRVDNSFEGRLKLATEGSLPKISNVLHKD